ncbi:MAG TPA: hypothetical protein VKG26_00740 [Bacteroidia bacterium]|nr:hypothetical protein [Bacteroidia bacterium]
MKNFYFLFCAVFLVACGGSNTKPTTEPSRPTINYLLQDDYINKAAAANRKKIKGVKGDIKTLTTYIKSLNDSVTTIAYALDYIKQCNLTSDAERDSGYRLFSSQFYAVISKLNDSLETTYETIFNQLLKDTTTTELTCLKKNLATCGIGVYSTEGNPYFDVLPDYFYESFKGRVPAWTEAYLSIRKDELKQGFTEDAGLLISYDELYNRIKRWEVYIAKYPNAIYKDEASSFCDMYMSVLVTGIDNSRIFDFDSKKLLPEIKTLYEKIKTDDTTLASTKLIAAYYNFLARHNFTDNDSIELFTKAHHIMPMLGVQPPTR